MLQCMLVLHSGSHTSLLCILICSHSFFYLMTAFRYRGKRHQLGYKLVVQSRPAHSLWKWKGKVCKMGLFPYHFLEVHPSNMQSRCITRREFLVTGTRKIIVTFRVLHCSSQHQQHYIFPQMNFSADVIVRSSRSPFPRFHSSMWCSVNLFHDVFLLWSASRR